MRRKDREITDPGEIRAILERARVLHLGLNAEEEPYVVPMHYGFSLEDGRLTLCVHCAKEGRKLELLRRDGRVFVEIDAGEALVPAVVYSVSDGRDAVIVEDEEEKAALLGLLMRTQTGAEHEITPAMAAAVCVLRIDVEEFSAKRRKG